MTATRGARPCCAPGRQPGPAQSTAEPVLSARVPPHATHPIEQATVPAGRFQMGDAHGDGHPADGEDHLHEVDVSGFTIDATTVTNEAYARFVDDTGYRTETEQYGASAVVAAYFKGDRTDVVGVPPGTPWWLGVRGASWRHPEGRGSDLKDRMDHPVVHVTWNDAVAYCRWARRRLPTEAEWEYASRGGPTGCRYPWGDDLLPGDGRWRCNIWQGTFPTDNVAADGWHTTAPVRSYQPNGWGLWQTVGNVWEWCADWFAADAYRQHQLVDPHGPEDGTSRTMRGGSFMCHDSYCNRYRNAARSSNTPDSSAANIGFRTVAHGE